MGDKPCLRRRRLSPVVSVLGFLAVRKPKLAPTEPGTCMRGLIKTYRFITGHPPDGQEKDRRAWAMVSVAIGQPAVG